MVFWCVVGRGAVPCVWDGLRLTAVATTRVYIDANHLWFAYPPDRNKLGAKIPQHDVQPPIELMGKCNLQLVLVSQTCDGNFGSAHWPQAPGL